MEGILGLIVLIAICVAYKWVRDAFWRTTNQKVLARKGHARGQSAVKSHTVFVVPAMAGTEVIQKIVATLGYPSTKSNLTSDMALTSLTDSQATFALGNEFRQAWESRLNVVDQPDGAHGDYEVIRWTLSDGIASGFKEMEIVERRIGEIATSIGGTVHVSVPE